jgi:hypothetical protein
MADLRKNVGGDCSEWSAVVASARAALPPGYLGR